MRAMITENIEIFYGTTRDYGTTNAKFKTECSKNVYKSTNYYFYSAQK